MVPLLLALLLVGEVTDADIAAYAARSQAERKPALVNFKKRYAAVRHSNMAREERIKTLQYLRGQITDLKSKSAPYYPQMLTFGPHSMGTLDDLVFKCIQVNGKNNALIAYETSDTSRVWSASGALLSSRTADKRKLLWLSGYPTDSFVDGENVRLEGVFIVSGKKTYDDTNDGTTTVPMLEWADIAQHRAKFLGEAKH